MLRNLPTILGSRDRLRKAALETTATAVEESHVAAAIFCQNVGWHFYILKEEQRTLLKAFS